MRLGCREEFQGVDAHRRVRRCRRDRVCRIIEKAKLAVPDLDLGGRSGKGEGDHRLLSGPGDVFDPAAGKVLVAQGMVFPDQGVPEILLPGPGIQRHDGDLPQILEGSQNRLVFTDDLLCRFQ